jgi:hypothetical protein
VWRVAIMTVVRTVLLCSLLALVCGVSPALAGCNEPTDQCWGHKHHRITHMENRIAYLEADPDVDDGDKGPVIDHLRRKIMRTRAAIGPRWPHWPSPCCYSRKPIHIR